jgi:hypothetical protein
LELQDHNLQLTALTVFLEPLLQLEAVVAAKEMNMAADSHRMRIPLLAEVEAEQGVFQAQPQPERQAPPDKDLKAEIVVPMTATIQVVVVAVQVDQAATASA